ncbi:MAG TPA: EAL domain-containing protein [Usitatibacter sp.]|nr:EAL domain-containing protein [Usitatibacter sp.]
MSHSHCRSAEELLRAAGAETLRWNGAELNSHFQPIFSVRRQGCVGHEALVRASGEGRVPLAPSRLFAEAFASGRGVELDWICRALHLRNFARMDPGEGMLLLNVHCAAAVEDASAAGEFADMVRFYGLVPQRVCVEMLEDHCIDEPGLRAAVGAYRGLGTRIAMDDFGTGRSNFDRIVALRPDIVKMDRSILIDAVGDEKSRNMLPAIIELLHEAGAQVAVEGIESANEALIAIESGADLLQGYYFALPAAKLDDGAFGTAILTRLLRMRGHTLTAVAAG